MEDWLFHTGFVTRSETEFTPATRKVFLNVRRSPSGFCILAGRCGPVSPRAKRSSGRGHGHVSILSNPHATGATIVRLRLLLNVTHALVNSKVWPHFAGTFLHDVAALLDCSPDRYVCAFFREEWGEERNDRRALRDRRTDRQSERERASREVQKIDENHNSLDI